MPRRSNPNKNSTRYFVTEKTLDQIWCKYLEESGNNPLPSDFSIGADFLSRLGNPNSQLRKNITEEARAQINPEEYDVTQLTIDNYIGRACAAIASPENTSPKTHIQGLTGSDATYLEDKYNEILEQQQLEQQQLEQQQHNYSANRLTSAQFNTDTLLPTQTSNLNTMLRRIVPTKTHYYDSWIAILTSEGLESEEDICELLDIDFEQLKIAAFLKTKLREIRNSN